eukprot:g2237.t1
MTPSSGPTKGGTMLKLQGPGIVPRGIVFDLTVEFGGTRRVAYAESGSKEDHDDTVRVLVPEMVDATSYEKSVQLFLIAYDLKGDVLDGSDVFRGLLVKHLTLDLNHISVFAGPGSNRTQTMLLSDPVKLNDRVYSIDVKIPPGAGRDGTLVVFRGGQPSNTVKYHYAAPSLASVSRSRVPTLGSDLEITGANFGPSWIPIHVYFGSTDNECVVKQRSHRSVVCALPAGFGSVKKRISLRVAGQGVCMPESTSDVDVEKACSLISVAYSPPQIFNVVQPRVRASQGGFQITIEGENFGGASIVPFDQVQIVLGPAPDFGDGIRECTLLENTFSNNQIECTVPPGISLNIPISVRIGDQNSDKLASVGRCSDNRFEDEFSCITAGRWVHAGCWSVPPMSATLENEDAVIKKLPQFSDEKSCSGAGNSWRPAACTHQSEDGATLSMEGDRILSEESCEANPGSWASAPPGGSKINTYGYSPAYVQMMQMPEAGFPTNGSLSGSEISTSVVNASKSNYLLITGFNFGIPRIAKVEFFLGGIEQPPGSVLYHNHTHILLRVPEGEGRYVPLDLLVQSRSVFTYAHFKPNISYSFAAIDFFELADTNDDGYAPT